MSHQERNELASQDWMNKYKHEYFETAKLLHLIDRETPKHKKYDEAWIAGASRIGVLTRIVDYQYVLSKYDIKIKGNVKILAGERELWANIDGISPVIKDKIIEAYKLKSDLDTIDISLPVGEDEARIQEGQEYLLDLATRYQISLNPLNPFIQYTTKEECPIGRFPGRIYPNYASSTSKKLTESLMSQDLINTYFKKDGQKINVINTLADQYKRPTTGTTARDAATQLVKSIINGDYKNQKEFIILFETNNPYIERQTIATQREVNKILKDYKLDSKGYLIKIDGIGFKCKQDVATVHSEFAALIAEKWKTSTESRTEKTLLKRPIEQLQFQTRDNSFITVVQPDVTKVNISQNLVQDFFDQYLP